MDCVTKAKIAGKIVTKGLEDAIGAARAPAAELEGVEMVAVHTLVAKIFIAVPNLVSCFLLSNLAWQTFSSSSATFSSFYSFPYGWTFGKQAENLNTVVIF